MRGASLATRHASRKQDLDSPPIVNAQIQLSPVKTTGHALPELDAVRREAKAGPVRRARHDLTLEAALELGDASLEELLFRDRPTLLGRPCSDLATAGS